MKRFDILLLLNLSLWASGCQYILGGIEVQAAQTAVEPPSNVAVYLSVMNGQAPMADLGARDFQLYEDGEPLEPSVTSQTLLNTSEIADHRTLLVLDMGDAAGSRAVSRGAALLVSRLVGSQSVIVCAFDGRSGLHLIGEFARTFDRAATPEEFDELTQWKPTPGPRDLNGAIVAAVGMLRNALGASPKPLRVGTVVVFARGGDTAAKTPPELRNEVVTTSGYDFLAIGVEAEDSDFDLAALGPDGVETTRTLDDIAVAFEETASAVVARARSYYLLSYCSPSRAGIHELGVEVSDTDPDGTLQRGFWSFKFDATGFSSGCNPGAMPRFGRVVIQPPPIAVEMPPPNPPAAPPPEVVAPPPAPAGTRRPSAVRPPAAPPPQPLDPATETPSEDSVVPPPVGGGYAPIEE